MKWKAKEFVATWKDYHMLVFHAGGKWKVAIGEGRDPDCLDVLVWVYPSAKSAMQDAESSVKDFWEGHPYNPKNLKGKTCDE